MKVNLHTQATESSQGRKHLRRGWKIFWWVGGSLFGLMLAGGAFVKFDPTDAAVFTDNVLRPILGPTIVVSLEKTFFNLSDKAQQVVYSYKTATQPLLGDTRAAAVPAGGDLNTTPISTDPTLSPVHNEGQWRDWPIAQFPGKSVAAYTIIRPDASRPYAFTTVLQLDMRKLRLHVVAGTKQPGGPVGNPGPGVVPSDVIQSGNLVAAFDGGFQYRDGAYGMYANNEMYLPLKNNLASLIGYTDGHLGLVNYQGQDLGRVDFIRQNCPMLVQDGQNAVLDAENKKLWGRTLSTGMYTWRSGIGVTKTGDLLFAVGNNLTPETLAHALVMAGATNAMQLDINPNWVRFNFFTPSGPGTYTTTKLLRALKDGSDQYLKGYEKDFFYLTANK